MSHSKTLSRGLLALAMLLPMSLLAQEPAAPAAPEAAAAAPAAPVAASAVTFSKKGADTCLSCHDDEVTLAVFHTKHGQPADARSPFGKGQLQCEACHGPAGDHTKRVKKGETRPPVIRSFGTAWVNGRTASRWSWTTCVRRWTSSSAAATGSCALS